MKRSSVDFRFSNGVTLSFTDTSKNRFGILFKGEKGWVHVNRGILETSPESLLKERIGEGGSPVELALVCLTGPRGIFELQPTSPAGEAAFLTEDKQAGEKLVVTVTARDHVPYQAGILVEETAALFLRADANADGATDISDAVAILVYLFLGDNEVPCEQAGDANDDGDLGISDVVYVLSFLFLDGKAMEPPVGNCGVDPTGHNLPCDSFPGCK